MNDCKLTNTVHSALSLIRYQRHNFLFAAVAAIVFCIKISPVTAADDSSIQGFAALVPASTPLLILAPNTEELEKSWKKTAFFELYQEPAMQPFWDELKKRNGGVLPTDRIGVTWAELNEVSSGGAALIGWPTTDKSLAYVLMVDASARPEKAIATRDLIRQSWQKRGYELSKRVVKNVEVVVAKMPPPKLTEAAPSNSKTKTGKGTPALAQPSWRFAFVFEGKFVVCDREAVIDDILGRLKDKRADSLAKSEVFSAIFENGAFSTKKAGQLCWFVDPWQLFRGTVDQNARSNRTVLRSYNFLQRQGFDAVKAFGGVIEFGSSDNDLEYETRIIVKWPLKKGAELLSFVASSDLQTPAWLPKTLTEVSSTTFKPESVINAYGSIYDEIYGENYEGAFKELLDSIETEPDGPEALVRRDLLDCTQPLVVWASDFEGQKSEANPSGKRQLIVVLTSCEEKSLNAVKRFFADDDQIQGESAGAAWIWQNKEQAKSLFPFNSNDPLSVKIDALAIYKQYIIVASDRKLAREAIQTAAELETNKALPVFFVDKPSSGVCSKMFRESTAQFQSNFELIRQGKLHQSGTWDSLVIEWLLMSTSLDSNDMKTIGKATLPNFAELKATFGTESREMLMTASGWSIRGAMKKREKTAGRASNSQ